MTKIKSTKEQTMIYKTLHRQQKVEQLKSTKTGGELMCCGRISSSCSTSGTRRVTLVTNTMTSHRRGKNREVFTTSGTYTWPFVTQIVRSC